MLDWAQWCWRVRHNLRMTQAEAAECAGVNRRTWARWEDYTSLPSEYTRERVRDAMVVELAAYAGARSGKPPRE